MWVFGSLDQCDETSPPISVGTLYADAQCRSIENVFNPDYESLFPGNYQAECVFNTTESAWRIQFTDSGCLSDTCSTRGSGTVCDRDNTKASSLYSRLTVPTYMVQSQNDASSSGYYTCLRLQGSGTSVTFVVFGDCTAPGCAGAPPPTNTVALPTAQPTPLPTRTPTRPPTGSPTIEPTERPTRSPQEEPTTLYPTATLTKNPTSTPTAEPFPSGSVSGTELVQIKLSPMSTQLIDLELWEDSTKEQIEEFNVDTEIYEIVLTDITQTLVGDQLIFDFRLTVVSDGTYPTLELFRNAFKKEEDRATYLLKLVPNDPNFKSARLVEIESIEEEEASNSSGSGAIIGGAVGAVSVLVLMAGGFLIYKKVKPQKAATASRTQLEEAMHTSNTTDGTNTNNATPKWTHEIVVDPSADDVSTLGGSIQGLNMTETGAGDEPTASVNLDYDFGKNRYRSDATEDPSRSEAPTMFSHRTRLGLLGDAVFDDDNSLDQQYALNEHEEVSNRLRPFEVRAPPGLLGMVVDTPDGGGCPIVRALKPDSSLVNQVQVGDRLVSVDHQDVTKLTAFQVSNIISEKQNQTRVLVFVRYKRL